MISSQNDVDRRKMNCSSQQRKDLGWRNKKKGRLSNVKVIVVHSLDSVLVFGSRFGC